MPKSYWLTFTSGDPRLVTGLSPTFIIFGNTSGATATPPGITEIISGTGLYTFSYAATNSIVFTIDGGSAAGSNRYLTGVLDPIQAVDQIVGTTGDSFGSTATDPSTIMGYVKRALEFNEGNAVYNKTAATWDIYSRGSSTLLREKTLTNTTSQATKT